MFPQHQQQHYPAPNVRPIIQQRPRTVNNIISGIIPGILGATQLFLWIIIIALEIVSVYFDAGRGTIYAGFWCSMVFFVTWVSMFCYLCCGKSSGCGSYLVIQNIINLVFAIILLIFTSRFIKNPCLCYGSLCFIPNWDYFYDGNYDDYHLYLCTARTFRKLPVLKGLLSCAVLILLCNVIFIAAYLIAWIKSRGKARSTTQQPDIMYQHQSATVQMGRQPPHHPNNMAYHPHQHHPQHLYPVQYIQAESQWPSAPPPYGMYSEKF